MQWLRRKRRRDRETPVWQVMETVLSPYLRGGGARSINFQARPIAKQGGNIRL